MSTNSLCSTFTNTAALNCVSSGSGADTGGYIFLVVEAYYGHHIPCSDKELTCVVCTK